jgi:hypothetical protein
VRAEVAVEPVSVLIVRVLAQHRGPQIGNVLDPARGCCGEELVAAHGTESIEARRHALGIDRLLVRAQHEHVARADERAEFLPQLDAIEERIELRARERIEPAVVLHRQLAGVEDPAVARGDERRRRHHAEHEDLLERIPAQQHVAQTERVREVPVVSPGKCREIVHRRGKRGHGPRRAILPAAVAPLVRAHELIERGREQGGDEHRDGRDVQPAASTEPGAQRVHP